MTKGFLGYTTEMIGGCDGVNDEPQQNLRAALRSLLRDAPKKTLSHMMASAVSTQGETRFVAVEIENNA